jgi:membrane-bound lytic murein transglycosylase F
LRSGVAALLMLCLSHCGRAPSALDLIRSRGELRVATLNGPNSWFEGARGPAGLEYELASQFATRLGVRLVVYPVATEGALIEELRSHRADLVAAHLSYGLRWLADALPARPYDEVAQVVLFQRGHARPANLNAVLGRTLSVGAASPQATLLGRLKASDYPELNWTELADADPLSEVANGHADYTVVDVGDVPTARQHFPNLAVAFELPERRPAQWLLPRDAPELQRAVDAFFSDLASTNDLQEILARSSGAGGGSGGARHFHFGFAAARDLVEHMGRLLPGLQPMFETASADTGVDWRLLAAIGYQESQWDPLATSPNGAGGIMMLMPDTADELGVEDRHDPRENIMAGARYFVQVHDMLPERIPEPDRTWLALAAYNVGFGHLEDARIITQMNGGNPDVWEDVRQHLPLLADESWYPQAKRGYARGWEPVQFVERVQGFLNVLERRNGDGSANGPEGVSRKSNEPLRTASRS